MKKTKDEILLEACKHRHALECLAFKITNNWASAEDIFQDSLIVVGDRWEDFRPGSSIFSWLRRIVWYQSMNYIKVRKRRNWTSFESVRTVVEEELCDSQNEENDLLKTKISALRSCMQHLPLSAKNLLCEYYSKGQSCKEIAEGRNWTLSNAKDSLYRLRNRLRSCIKTELTSESELNPEHEELFEAYCGEGLSEERCAVLNNLLTSDPVAKKEFFAFLDEWAVFSIAARENVLEAQREGQVFVKASEDIGVHSNDRMEVFPGTVNKDTRFSASRWIAGFGVAACLTLGVSLWHLIPADSQVFGHVAGTSGKVLYKNDEASKGVALRPGQEIVAGASLELMDDSVARLSVLGEDTSIELFANTEVRVGSGGFGHEEEKRVFLRNGELNAEISRQANAIPFVFETSNAEIIVLGTRFKLLATPMHTKIEMFEGRAMVTDINSGTKELVSNGISATLSNGKFQLLDSRKFERKGKVNLDDPALIALYRFEGKEKGAVNDSSAPNRSGIILNLLPKDIGIPGKFGNAIFSSLESPNGRLRLKNVPIETLKDELTISLWLNPIEVKETLILVESWQIKQRSNVGKAGMGWKFHFLPEENVLAFKMSGFVKNPEKQCFSDPSFGPVMKEWNHIVVIFKKGNVQFYVNGQNAGERVLSDQHFTYADNPRRSLVVFHSRSASKAGMDELMIFNKALRIEEVTAMQ